MCGKVQKRTIVVADLSTALNGAGHDHGRRGNGVRVHFAEMGQERLALSWDGWAKMVHYFISPPIAATISEKTLPASYVLFELGAVRL
jgi:hypothetical protein